MYVRTQAHILTQTHTHTHRYLCATELFMAFFIKPRWSFHKTKSCTKDISRIHKDSFNHLDLKMFCSLHHKKKFVFFIPVSQVVTVFSLHAVKKTYMLVLSVNHKPNMTHYSVSKYHIFQRNINIQATDSNILIWVHIVQIERGCTVFVWIKNKRCILGNWLKILFNVQQTKYFLIQMVRRDFKDSGNTFRMAISAVMV